MEPFNSVSALHFVTLETKLDNPSLFQTCILSKCHRLIYINLPYSSYAYNCYNYYNNYNATGQFRQFALFVVILHLHFPTHLLFPLLWDLSSSYL